MGILARAVLREVSTSAVLGAFLFTFVLFLQQVNAKLFELLVRSAASPETVGYLFALILPQALTFTIPVGVLVGVLIALSRMSSDAEITAMRAAGVPSRRLLAPVLIVATLGVTLTAAAAVWLTPLSIRERFRVINRLLAAQLTAEIQPRVFEEQFPNKILYVGDVIPGPLVRWRNIFIADITPPEERPAGIHEAGEGPRITVASEAVVTPDVAQNRIQLSLADTSTHSEGKDWTEYVSTSFPNGEQVLEAQKPLAVRPRLPWTEMDTVPLWHAVSGAAGKDSIEAAIELHQRLALPPACLLFALVGLPLGISSRKGGKSSSVVLTVLIGFAYYMALIGLIGLARQGAVPVAAAVWTPNVVLALAALVLLFRLERPGDRDLVAVVRDRAAALLRSIRGSLPSAPPAALTPARRFLMVPQILDAYVLGNFLFYFVVLLCSFVLMTHVFTFFDLLSDIVRNRIPMSVVFTYLLFLTPHLVYILTPVGVLVAVLVTFGVLTKNNEVTALKACGVSVYRLSVPVLLVSTVLSVALFAFDQTYLPEANRIQDAIRNQIKGRPVQTYLRPDRKWIFGQGSRIYYYRYLDKAAGEMLGVSVYEINPATFRLVRHISAEKARWEPRLNTWIFQNGWSRDLKNSRPVSLRAFQGGTATFPELDESPSYFLKEVMQDKQMNFRELAAYIDELRQSGFDTVRLQVQLHKKF
ncbi:MAG: LptF/LptG family permease, partial [Acidobacteria bacterium]|nr:LptF/LptG family permease [Acidobacteriota bacterium]